MVIEMQEGRSFELIPAIDLKGGKCVRLQQGNAARATEYSDDPLATALHWQESGATRLHLVDLDGAFSGGSTHLEVVGSIFRQLKIPVQFGGGLRTLEHVTRILDLGAARAILGTAAAEQPELVEEAAKRWPGAIVVGIDSRNGQVMLRGWVDQSSMRASELAARMKSLGVERLIYTDVTRDGTLKGANVAETERLAREVGIRVIASGGVCGIEDIRRLWERRGAGIEGVILGRALYESRLDLADLVRRIGAW